ncbi:MAG: sigma-70 family RNA polymerase sigma factor [Pseudomonadota bacterium]
MAHPFALTAFDGNMQRRTDTSTPVAGGTRETDERLLELLSRCALRDQAALRSLYDEVAAKLNGIAFRITGARDLAEEVLQTSFIQIWRDAARYRPDVAQPMTWLTSIVRHRALDRLKAERRRGRVIDETVELETMQLVSEDKGPMDNFALHETQGRLKTCLQRLSDSQQRAVMLAYCYGYTRDEIAAKLDTAAGTVKSWLHRGLQRLEQCLTQ